ncbi:transcriptional regulator [Sulfurimonas sediminis]|uniref:Transcriptional regulator n=1 Tax=Sulfurimonas sediminis TaxID=2590020 RepID=A0A7M1AYH6_9BACT|nr:MULTISPECIES: transcriptional regulator [Sulfurimonas]QOP42529.1 transcriptional regulator [Sulfurimonas sediminis]UCN00420.1 hypothetical protein LCX93_00465 [Sulfurimonas sp. SWIR-19]
MKKIEVIIESVYIKRLLKVFKKHKIGGYTVIKDVEGYGGHGFQTADDVSDVLSNILVFSVCKKELLENMQKDLKKFLETYGGKCIVSDATLL